MTTLLQDIGHHNKALRRIRPLSKEGTAAGIGIVVGALLMAIICMAIRMA